MKKKGFNFAFAIMFFFSLTLCGCTFLFSANKISKVEAASGDWTDNCSSAVITGGGTQNNPYIIDTAVKFAYIAWGINNGYTQWNTAFYKQTANIDLSAHYWNMMNTFAGYYDGQGYTLSGLTCDSSLTQFAIIKELSGTWINSGFVNVNASIEKDDAVECSALAITATSTSLIGGCYVTGTISAHSTHIWREKFAAGLVVYSNGTIKNCFSTASVSAITTIAGNTRDTVGGGIAAKQNSGTIENCYNIGNIFVRLGRWKVGGIVGWPSNGTIKNCANLRGSCSKRDGAGTQTQNDFYNYYYDDGNNSTTTNCHVVSADTLKSNTNSPLDTWNFSDNTTNRIWGYPAANNEFYNQGYPALRVFYENFTVVFFNDTNTAVVFEKAPLSLTVLTYDGNVSSSGVPTNPNMTEISILPNQQNYFVGDKITLSATVNENGQIEFNSTTYIFTHWKIGDFLKDGGDGVDPNNLTFTMPATDTVVYACFISTDAYYAFVDWQNNIVEEGIVSTTATITAPDISKFTRSGYTFNGFFSKSGTPLISVENGEYVSTYTLNGVTERVVFYPKYTKHFDCEIVFSLNNQKTTQYDINPNLSLYFACVSPTGHKFSSKIQDGEKTSINLSNETFVGEWLLNFVTPTYYEAKIFVDGVQNTTGLFDVNILSNQIQIDIMLTKIADKYLYDSTQAQTSTNDVKIIDHYQYVDGVKTYTGVNKELKNHEFAPLSNEQTLTSPYGYENKDIIGTVNWGGLYNFTDANHIEEGANITAKDLGSTVYKLSFSNNYASMYPYNYDWSKETIYSMTDLLYTKPYLDCFHRNDLKTFLLVAYEFATCPWNTLAYDGRSATELEPYLKMVRNEFAELVDNLMLEFRNEQKTFILSNWEADNSFGSYCWDYIEALRGTISDAEVNRRQQLALKFFTAYINARQDGIILGRQKFATRGITSSTVVYGNFEVNAATEEVPWTPNRPRAYSAIIPNTYCDLYSLSDWYSIWTETGNNTEINWDAETDAYTITMFLDNIWHYVKQNRTFLPTSDPNYKPCIWNFGTDANNPIKNLMITEFGSDETKENQRNFHHVKTTITEAINWGIYKITYWEIYTNVTNQTPVGAQPRVEDCKGLWLIRPDGTFSQGFWYMKGMIDGFDYFTNPLKLVYSSHYVDTHGLDWDKYKDTVIWRDDLVDTSKMKSYSKLYSENGDNSDARLNFVDLSAYAQYLDKYTGYFGYDTTGLARFNQEYVDNNLSGIASSLSGTLTQITYEAKSNRFGFLMYNYNSLSQYIDATTNAPFKNPIVFVMGKNQYGKWERIINTKVEEKLADGNTVWHQTYVSVVTPVGKYSEFRIVFNEELNYNVWDPILTSVFFFKGGNASSNYILG